MPMTSPDNLRWPLPSDDPDIPRDIGYLATDVQVALDKKADAASVLKFDLAGYSLVAGTKVAISDNEGAATIPFDLTFKEIPLVVATIGDAPGTANDRTPFVNATSTTGFNFNGMASNQQFRVNYLAIGIKE